METSFARFTLCVSWQVFKLWHPFLAAHKWRQSNKQFATSGEIIEDALRAIRVAYIPSQLSKIRHCNVMLRGDPMGRRILPCVEGVEDGGSLVIVAYFMLWFVRFSFYNKLIWANATKRLLWYDTVEMASLAYFPIDVCTVHLYDVYAVHVYRTHQHRMAI